MMETAVALAVLPQTSGGSMGTEQSPMDPFGMSGEEALQQDPVATIKAMVEDGEITQAEADRRIAKFRASQEDDDRKRVKGPIELSWQDPYNLNAERA
ncbi:hypothetical protein ACH4U5_00430 [Streptomyces sp. NPDC020858]|uniref:hypothetical protein n=1 Tax=Streptomyces sp. NPDC020858 TaxID=3365097 RepID=UPI00378E4919